MDRYARIGELFTMYGSPLFVGAVIASADAIYFVASLEPFGFKSLFTRKLGKKLTSATVYLPSPLSALDPSVTADSSWPLKSTAGFVLELTKDDIVRIHKPLLRSLTIETAYGMIRVRKGVSQRFPAIQTLADFGWQCGT